MKKILPLIPISILLTSLPVSAKDAHKECLDSKDYAGCMSHQQCIDAADYAGCMKFSSNSSVNESSSNVEKEKCVEGPKLWCVCISNCGEDFTGMPKIKGWLRIEWPEERYLQYIDL